jgi:hypothetical protein
VNPILMPWPDFLMVFASVFARRSSPMLFVHKYVTGPRDV